MLLRRSAHRKHTRSEGCEAGYQNVDDDWLMRFMCPKMYDVSPRKNYVSKNRLDAQIESTGNSIRDIKAVIMGHLRKSMRMAGQFIQHRLIEAQLNRRGPLRWSDAFHRHGRSHIRPRSRIDQCSLVPFHQGKLPDRLIAQLQSKRP